MELFERYIYDVGRRLPKKLRPDVERELRSLLQDALEERAAEAGRPADEEMAVGVLQEFDPPQRMAASYGPRRRCLIGPALYPAYQLAVAIVLAIIGAIYAFGLIIGLSDLLEAGPVEAVANSLAGLFSALTSALGSITLVFAAVERVPPAENLQPLGERHDATWDPRCLPKMRSEDEPISVGGLAIGIFMSAALLILFNFFPEKIGVASY
jgi:hypothetical protein